MSYDALRRGRHSEPGRIYHVITATQARQPLFTDLTLGRIAISQMKAEQSAGHVVSLAWVLMPDHLHWLFTLTGKVSLDAVMQRFKGRAARAINMQRNSRSMVWQRAYYDHALRDDEDVRVIARYIVANPLRAGLVRSLGDYPLWDAIWLDRTLDV
ncbi:MAG: transposase [Thiohalomonadaceae bacterium]